MRQFYPLTIVQKQNETNDSVRLSLAVPEKLKPHFDFLAGQHLPVRTTRAGNELRRTYSICSAPGSEPLEIGVRIQPGGAFSQFVAQDLKVGDVLDAMPPFGQFHARPGSSAARTYLVFAAGSGITPVLSIIRYLLESEPDSRISLFYGNRRQATTMFIEDLFALKNRFPGRLQLLFLFSREEQEFSITSGRLDADKVREIWQTFCKESQPDEAFICGPDSMIDTVGDTLIELGMPAANLHTERFGAPRTVPVRHEPEQTSHHSATVTVIMDGRKRSFPMNSSDNNIVDAAAAAGIDLPFSCKGGVCATCRCHLSRGEVSMALNYGLENWELEKGFILACQSKPTTDSLILDYDRT